MNKFIQTFLLSGASMLGIVQVVVKFIKELLTLIVNILFPIIPDGKFEEIILKVRSIVNKIDEWLEKIKAKLL